MSVTVAKRPVRPAEPAPGEPPAPTDPPLAPGSFRLADAAHRVDAGEPLGTALADGLIEPPPGFEARWLHLSVDGGNVHVELELPGGVPAVAGDVRSRGERTRQLLALVVAEANALLPQWRAARARGLAAA
jgi:hypothetical protein